ncbi:MAG TPA: hypothetical protein VHS03_11300 [Gaiellaceae bacterium]|jgi:hypothetical protein|nr:hypothetical protein [Gaiellaceae bacterium]
MRRLALVAALAAATFALPAGAATAPSVTLRLNDGFVVKGTNIVCAVQLSKTLVPGAKLVSCFLETRQGPVPKSYTVALAVNGEVALGRVSKSGNVTVVKRLGGGPFVPSKSRSAPGKVYEAKIGSVFLVKGTAMTCGVSTQSFGGKKATTVACFKLDQAKKPRPNSYGIGITGGGAFLVHFDAKSKGTPVKIVQHGH